MDQNQFLLMMPSLQPEELIVIQKLTSEMSEAQKQQFYILYQSKRKDPQTIMIMTIIGFFGIAGIQRFVIGETGMGILYLLTIGFCGIGTIIDLVNYKSLASQYNQKEAIESATMMKMMMR